MFGKQDNGNGNQTARNRAFTVYGRGSDVFDIVESNQSVSKSYENTKKKIEDI